jgi:hypothetical protein
MHEQFLSFALTNRSKAFECSTAFRRVGVLVSKDQSIEASFDPTLLARANLVFAALCGVVTVTHANGPHSVGNGVAFCAVLTLTLLSITLSLAGRIRTGFSLGE